MLVFRFSRTSGRFEIMGVSGRSDRPRTHFRPPVDISFKSNIFTIRMDLPGVSPDDISIEAEESEINIVGNIPAPDAPGPCRLMERPSGPFMRKLTFHGRISPDGIEARLEDGVLALRVPAPDLSRDPTTIEIRIEGAD